MHFEIPVRLDKVVVHSDSGGGGGGGSHFQCIRAGGDLSVVVPNHPEPVAWSFLQTTSPASTGDASETVLQTAPDTGTLAGRLTPSKRVAWGNLKGFA